MCWQQTIAWDNEHGHNTIDMFTEWLCFFVALYPDTGEGDVTFPERTARANAEG